LLLWFRSVCDLLFAWFAVKLFLGTTDVDDESKIIFETDGMFEGGIDHSFIPGSTNGGSTVIEPIQSDTFLTLELRFDLYPEEVALQLRISNSETAVERQSNDDAIIFFRPPRYYAGLGSQVVTEVIPIPAPRPGLSRRYTFIVTDSYGDGLCCSWAGEDVEPGYTLWRGAPSDNNVIVDSKLEGKAREVTTFIVDGNESSQPDGPSSGTQGIPISPYPKVEVKVTIKLDTFPDETGFKIEDLDGTILFDMPAGTYREKFALVEEVISLEVGSYKFMIVDVFGDGLTQDDSFYRIDLVGDDSRPALVTGNGVFVSQEEHIFVLEGESAEYPFQVKFKALGKPQEFGFYVDRVDLPGADARIASVPQGSYSTPNEDVSVRLLVKEKALYRIVFQQSGNKDVVDTIQLLLGSEDANDIDAISYTFDAGNEEEFQVKLFAGDYDALEQSNRRLTLNVAFDQFPHEVEWILIKNTGNSLRDTEVIAYGPPTQYTSDLAETLYQEIILLPPYEGEQSFSMILTDSAGDGSKFFLVALLSLPIGP